MARGETGLQADMVRRVRVEMVNSDATEVLVRDGNGRSIRLDGTIRPKGTALPEQEEIWLIERIGHIWILKAQEKAGVVDLGPELNLLIAEEVARRLAEQAEAEATRRAQEAALAAGILGGDATILIQPTEPGSEHQNETTLWIDTSFGRNRPMRWSVEDDQWIAVIDQIAIEAARRAVLAEQAAQAAEAAAQAAQAAADGVADAAADAVDKAEQALAAAAGKGRVIYGDPEDTPGEEHSLLIGPGNRLYIWNPATEVWDPIPDSQLDDLQNLIDGLQGILDAQSQTLIDLQEDLVGVQGKIDGKSTIYPIGSEPDLGPEDVGDLRLLADGGVEVWTGTEWVAADPRVAEAVNAAAEALDLANTKSTTYYKATKPTLADIEPPETAFHTNDFWLRSTDNRLHRWDGNDWAEVKDAALDLIEGEIADILDELTGLEGKIDGKSTIYVGDTAPEDVGGPEDTGDIWIDTAGGGRVYKVWDGDEWIVTDDPRIADILDGLNTKVSVYYGDEAPTTVNYDLNPGDLWVRESDNRMHRWSGTEWEDITDKRLLDALAELVTVQDGLVALDGRIDGKSVIYFQAEDPAAGNDWGTEHTGDVWIHPGTDEFKSWSGTAWELITDPAAVQALEKVTGKITTYYGTAEPTAPADGFTEGDLWLRAPDNRLHRWDGGDWIELQDQSIADLTASLIDFQDSLVGPGGLLDGKSTIWFQTEDPSLGASPAWGVEHTGDIWIDPSTETFSSWTGTAWQLITDPAALEALALVGMKITTYYGPGEPTEPAEGFVEGDLWIRDLDNRLHRWNGVDWVELLDHAIEDLTQDLTDFQNSLTGPGGLLDGKSTIYYQTADPSDGADPEWGEAHQGDIWINPVTGQFKSWNASSWVTITDPAALEALERVTGKITTYYGEDEPTPEDITPPETQFRSGDLWIRATDNRLHRWNGVAWAELLDHAISDLANQVSGIQGDLADLDGKIDGRAVIYYQADDPADEWWGTAETGDIWIDISIPGQSIYKVWNGGDWATITDPAALEALQRVTGKITTYYKATEPVASDILAPETQFRVGDLWVRSGDNRLHRWDGDNWVELKDQAIDDLEYDLGLTSDYIEGLETDLFDNIIPGIQGQITLAGGRFTGSGDAPTLADGAGKPVGAIWNRYGANRLVGTWMWDGAAWQIREPQHVHIDDMTVGQLSGIRLVANSVLTKHLAVGDFENYVENPEPLSQTDVDDWGWGPSAALNTSAEVLQVAGRTVVELTTSNNLANAQSANYRQVPTKEGDQWHLEATMHTQDGTTRSGGIGLMDQNGVILVGAVTSGSTMSFLSPLRHVLDVTIPAGVTGVRPFLFNSPAFSQTAKVQFWDMEMRRKATGVLIGDGAVSAQQVNAESVAAAIGEFVYVEAENILAGNLNVELNIGVNGSLRLGVTSGVHIIAQNNEITVYAPPEQHQGGSGAPKPMITMGGTSGGAFTAFDPASGDELGGLRADGTMFTPELEAGDVLIGGESISDVIRSAGRGLGTGYVTTSHAGYSARSGLVGFEMRELLAGHQYRISISLRGGLSDATAGRAILELRATTGSVPSVSSPMLNTYGTVWPPDWSFGNDQTNEVIQRYHEFTFIPTLSRPRLRLLLVGRVFGSGTVTTRDYVINVRYEGNPNTIGIYNAFVPPTTAPFDQAYRFLTHDTWSQYGSTVAPYKPYYVRHGTGGSSHYRTFLTVPSAARALINDGGVSEIWVELTSATNHTNSSPWIGTWLTKGTGTGNVRNAAQRPGGPTRTGKSGWIELNTAQRAAVIAGEEIVVGRTASATLADYFGTASGTAAYRPRIRIKGVQ